MPLPSESEFDFLRFDPQKGTVIRRPRGSGYGYWVGGHKVFWDETTEQYVLFYRERSPLEMSRGGKCFLATSSDGSIFHDVWSATKEEFAAASIEVGHCVRDYDGRWRLYVSYEVAGARHWRVDLLEADSLESFQAQSRRTVLGPGAFGVGSLKDPVVYLINGEYWVYVVGRSRSVPRVQGNRIEIGGGDATFLSKSKDGRYFSSLDYVFEPPNTNTWHGRRARINSIIAIKGGLLALYDGGMTGYDIYEEWCGLAWNDDDNRFERIEQSEPWIRSPWGCVRYVYALETPKGISFYYEFTCPDGSHDLRVTHVGIT